MEEKNMGGRPRLTSEQIAERKSMLLRKIEPYLKSGLSVNKTLHAANIHNSEFYKYMSDDEFFRDEVSRFRQFISVLVNNALVHELMTIVNKQNNNEPLSKEDREFLWRFALNSNLCKEEYGRREDVSLFDPEVEIQRVKRIMEEGSTKEIEHLEDNLTQIGIN